MRAARDNPNQCYHLGLTGVADFSLDAGPNLALGICYALGPCIAPTLALAVPCVFQALALPLFLCWHLHCCFAGPCIVPSLALALFLCWPLQCSCAGPCDTLPCPCKFCYTCSGNAPSPACGLCIDQPSLLPGPDRPPHATHLLALALPFVLGLCCYCRGLHLSTVVEHLAESVQ